MPDGKLELRITVAHESDYLYAHAPIEERMKFENEIKQTVINAFDLSKYNPTVNVLYVGKTNRRK